jgi:anti-anti-sigma factor
MIEIQNGPDSTVVCRPSGDLDFPSSLTFHQVIADLLHPGLKIVIDLRHAHYVDAVGLNALIGTARRLRLVGGTARIVNADPRLRCLLRSVGADRLIEAPPATTSPPDAA